MKARRRRLQRQRKKRYCAIRCKFCRKPVRVSRRLIGEWIGAGMIVCDNAKCVYPPEDCETCGLVDPPEGHDCCQCEYCVERRAGE